MIVIDAHVLYWYVQGDEKLGQRAQARVEQELSVSSVLVPAIAIWEIALASRRGRLDLQMDVTRWVRRILNVGGFSLTPVEADIAILAGTIDWAHRHPADRFVVATALHWGAPLLTADSKILAYAAAGHVQAIDARR